MSVAFRVLTQPFRRRSLEYLGSDYGGWAVPAEVLHPGSVCLTVGLGEDGSFDVALAERGCTVAAVDPTPRAIAYARQLQIAHPEIQLAPYALWTSTGEMEFFPPTNDAHVSFSLTNRQATGRSLMVETRTLDDLAASLGYGEIDLIKLDIEGAEYAVLPELPLEARNVKALCVEFHSDRGLWPMLKAVRELRRRGFDVASVRRTDVTLVRD